LTESLPVRSSPKRRRNEGRIRRRRLVCQTSVSSRQPRARLQRRVLWVLNSPFAPRGPGTQVGLGHFSPGND
jgi:hypothetical protein